jgi:sigma-54-specific transcriptional regulator
MHAAVLTCRERRIRAGDLRLAPWLSRSGQSPRVERVEDLARHLDRLFETRQERLLERVEALTVQRALERCGGNQVRTAQLLGISRNVLRTYLKRLGLLGDAAGRGEPGERTTLLPL